jgi:Ca-activated chloride channel family protein
MMLMRTLLRAGLCAGAFCLAACHDTPNHSRDSAKEALAKASGDASSASSEARAYVAGFTKKNPDECFTEVALEGVRLKGPQDDSARPAPTRVLVMIDGSGSMRGRIGGTTKLALARKAAHDFIDAMPASVEAGLLVFGQEGSNAPAGKAKSCAGITLLSPLTTDRARLRTTLDQVQAVGWTPLAAGLTQAETLLSQGSAPGAQVIYVVSDGQETCGGDPVAVARRINSGPTRAIVNVIGFDLPSADAQALTSVAKAGGGDFVNVSSEAELDRFTSELGRRSDNHVATVHALSDNHVKTIGAISRAHVCIGQIVSDEHVAMLGDLSDRSVRGEPAPFKEEAEALLKARHRALEARLESYRIRLSGAKQDAQGQIDAAAAAAH